MSTKNTCIKVSDFTKKYADKTACLKISFETEENSITGILGANGAGKTTLLKALCAIHMPTEGSIEICGIKEPSEIRKITGYVKENSNLDENLTVKESLFFQQDLFSVSGNIRKELFESAVKMCELKDVLFAKCGTLSKGYRQRVSLAKAICQNPKVLILDEVFSGLDPIQIIHIRTELKKLSQAKTIIFSTHTIEEAASLCDKILVMANGEVRAYGTSQELISLTKTKSLEEAFINLTSGNKK